MVTLAVADVRPDPALLGRTDEPRQCRFGGGLGSSSELILIQDATGLVRMAALTNSTWR
jgi:hypothetical protein